MTLDSGLQDVVEHFKARAPGYDNSSTWCTDPAFLAKIVEIAAPKPSDELLDVACGTGLIAGAFRSHVRSITAVDLTDAMASVAARVLDTLVICPAENLPFPADKFDLTVCRQGIQFMDAPRAIAEMVRVTRPGGRVILVNLCAYGAEDRNEFFQILRLRNPARRWFFIPGDLDRLLREAGCVRVELHGWHSFEDVERWANNGAIDKARRDQIEKLYADASPHFRERHAIDPSVTSRILDRMLFIIAVGWIG